MLGYQHLFISESQVWPRGDQGVSTMRIRWAGKHRERIGREQKGEGGARGKEGEEMEGEEAGRHRIRMQKGRR